MIKAVSFDFYGVIFSNFDWPVINERIHSDPKKFKEFRGLVDAANQGVIGNDRFRYRVANLADDKNHPDAPAVHLSPIINLELIKFIQKFRADYGTKLAILSNGGHSHVSEVLSEYQVLDVFDLIATSVELPSNKPEPEAFQYVAKCFGIKNDELLHVDDSPRHTEGAKRAGVQTILYTSLRALEEELKQRLVQS